MRRRMIVLVLVGLLLPVSLVHGRWDDAAQGSAAAEPRISHPVEARSAADYEMAWWTVDGGGGAFSIGGGTRLAGTVGQPDAGVLRGGEYTLSGGFWSGGETTSVRHDIYLPLVLRHLHT